MRGSGAIRYAVAVAAVCTVSACAARTAQVPPMPAPPHVAAARGPAVDRIRHTRLFRLAADLSYPPMAYRRNGTPTGFDLELATLLAKSLGARLQVIDTPIAVLKGGMPPGVDAAAGALGRGQIPGVASIPYYVSSQAILSPARGAITAAGQLRGLRVVVPVAGGGMDVARRAGANADVTDLPAQALAAVAAGRAQAAITDAPLALDFAANRPGLHVTAGMGEQVPFVIDVPANAPDLAAFVAAALRELDRDGGLATLRARWHL